MNDTVRLTIERIDITDIALPGDVLLDITETTESVLERGRLDNRALVHGKEAAKKSAEDIKFC